MNNWMDDLISRQAAIDALIGLTSYKSKREIVEEANKHENSWIGGVAECLDELDDLPPIQSEHENKTTSAIYLSQVMRVARNSYITKTLCEELVHKNLDELTYVPLNNYSPGALKETVKMWIDYYMRNMCSYEDLESIMKHLGTECLLQGGEQDG